MKIPAPPMQPSVLHLDPRSRPYSRSPAHSIARVDPAVRDVIRAVCAQGGPWPLVFVGPAGTGKTCAALCVLDYVNGPRRYATVTSLCDRLIAAQSDDTIETRRGILDDWRDADMAVLDELATRRVSDHHYEAVKSAIDVREGRPSIFISNDPLTLIATTYDDRIASRLAGGTVLKFDGTDRRLRREQRQAGGVT